MRLSHIIQPFNYPKKITALGDHLLARRLDKRLFQKDVGKFIGVDRYTILHWEKNITNPVVIYYPKIMDFLGYCPIRYAQNFGELLLLHRTHQGFTHKELAKLLRVDPASISRWETGGRVPWKKWKNRIINFFQMRHFPFEKK